MLRTLVCAVVALMLFFGATAVAKKGKGKGKKNKPTAVGKFVKFEKGKKDDGTLTITPFNRKKKGESKKKGEEEEKVEDKTFTVPNGTPVFIVKDEGKPEKATSPEAFEGVKPGTVTRIFTDAEGKVTRVGLGKHKKKGKGKGKNKKEQEQ